MNTIKLAADLVVGDVVAEKGGAALTVSAVERRGQTMIVCFERGTLAVPVGFTRVRASSRVTVVTPDEG